jgi:flavodoxin
MIQQESTPSSPISLQYSDEELNEPIFEGSTIKVFDVMAVLLFVMCTAGICLSLVDLLLLLLQLFLPSKNNLAKTKYKFKQYFASTFNCMKTSYYYCYKCCKINEKSICSYIDCSSKLQQKFFAADIIEILKAKMQQEQFHKDIKYFREEYATTEGAMTDHYNGDTYQKLAYPITRNPNNLSFTLNTDGIPPYKGSKHQIWSIYLTVNEMKKEKRYKEENVLFVGLWVGDSKPDFNAFLSILVKDLITMDSGVDIT